jgi:ribosome-associated translation inhibitor RaiA
MTIQFNADRNLTIHEEFRDKLNDLLTEELSRFSEHITRVEVHLSDENGHKQGQHDKKCLLAAKVEGRPPIAVTAAANNYELAVDAAIDKLISSLDTIFGRLNNR